MCKFVEGATYKKTLEVDQNNLTLVDEKSLVVTKLCVRRRHEVYWIGSYVVRGLLCEK